MFIKFAIAGFTAFLAASPSAALAQVSGVTPPSVTTEPPGTPRTSGLPSPTSQRSVIGPAGIPLGATELHTPGESPVMPGLPLNMTAHLLPNNASQGTSVGPAGIPLGATALGNLGVSPPAPVGVGSLTLMPGGSEACSISGASSSTPLFDGGGLSGTTGSLGASGSACPTSSMTTSESLATERSGAVLYRPTGPSGRSAGIAMGATELQNSGLSPAPASGFSSTTPLATTPLAMPSQLTPSP
jgi:hypothetical protein